MSERIEIQDAVGTMSCAAPDPAIVRWRSLNRAQRAALRAIRGGADPLAEGALLEGKEVIAAAAQLAECCRRLGICLNRLSAWSVLPGEQAVLAAIGWLQTGACLSEAVDRALADALARCGAALRIMGHVLPSSPPLATLLVRQGWLDRVDRSAAGAAIAARDRLDLLCRPLIERHPAVSLSSASLCAAGLSRHAIRSLRRRGVIARISHGRYRIA